MKTNIGITETDRQSVSDKLTRLLADEFVLQTKVRNAHWNIEGTNFHSMHIFFREQYKELDDLIDGVAERIRKIGHYAPASLAHFLQFTHLTEKKENKNDSISYIAELLHDHESIIEYLRGDINQFANKYNDAGTSDFITGLMRTHEEMAWMLRAHL